VPDATSPLAASRLATNVLGVWYTDMDGEHFMPQESYDRRENPRHGVLVSRGPGVDMFLEVRNGASFLVITVPKARRGLHRLAHEPALALNYGRNVASSSPKDYCDACSGNPGSDLTVTLSEDGGVDSIVEGRFMANGTSPFGHIPFHFGGKFRVRLPPDGALGQSKPLK
jgi:hypothetical protein